MRINASTFGLLDIQYIRIPLTNFELHYSLFTLIDFIIYTWIAYGIIGIFSVSDDIIPSEKVRGIAKILSIGFLVMGPILFGSVFLVLIADAYFTTYYPQSLVLIIGLVVTYVIIVFILRKYKIQIKVEPKEKKS